MEIIKIDPSLCTRWKYADRNSFEFGDINLWPKILNATVD